MARVLLSDFPMIDPNIYRDRLRDAVDEPIDVDVAELGSTDRLIDAAQGADAVVTDINSPVTAEAIAALDLSVVVRAAVGVDNIDVVAADDAGVVVTHVPDYCTDEVAAHSVSLLLTCLRSIAAYDDDVSAGGWSWEAGRPVRRIAESTIGLVSFGPIARRAARQLSGFGPELLAYDPFVDAEAMADADADVEKVGFDELFDRSDHVAVYAPLTDSTRGMVDADALGRLDESSVLVNVGRGPVVDSADLLSALETDGIKAAGLDVLDEEPPTDDPLVGREDTIVTPHAAWYSEEAYTELNERGAADVAAVLNGETPDGWVDPAADWL